MKLHKAFAGITVLTLLFAIPRTTTADQVFPAGLIDGFALPSDPAAPSSDLVAATNARFPEFGIQDFDLIANVNGGTADTILVHTFTGLPSGILGATLELRVQAGNDGATTTDAILLSFVDPTTSTYADAVVYARCLGRFDGECSEFLTCPDPGLIQATPWTFRDDVTFTLDLSALPLVGGGTLNLIPDLNSHGFLDVHVSDETGVDFMRLTIETDITVDIDIKPGSDPNSINLSSSGVIPTAILSSATFDATTEINPDTLSLAGARVRVAGRSGKFLCHNEDSNGDGLLDLVCKFENDLNAELGDSTASVEGETFDGTPIRGEDSIRIVPDN